MSYGGPLLSDLELRYPFAPRSRKFFESIPVEEGLASREVIGQTQSRLLSSLGRVKYEAHMSELVEFSSFFAAALVASQDTVLASRFSKKEAERAKEYFVKEEPRMKASTIAECFGTTVQVLDVGEGRASYSLPFEGYLSLVSKYELAKNPKWKLARHDLDGGTIPMSDNMLNDFFGECALGAIAEGVRNLRRAPFPKQLLGVKSDVIQYVPSPRPKSIKGYQYIEEMLKQPPVTDGRHRFSWLVLSPWATGIKLLSDDEAIELIQNYVSAGGNMDSGMKRFIAYNVRRARRLGLKPPTLNKLKTEHPDLYALLPKEAVMTDAEEHKSVRRQTPK